MLTIPIKAGWYHMILRGVKKEEYREIKPYYTIKFKKLFKCESLSQDEFVNLLKKGDEKRFTSELVLRNGYANSSPSSRINFTLLAKEGNPDWGAEKGVMYYALRINSLEEIIEVDRNKW